MKEKTYNIIAFIAFLLCFIFIGIYIFTNDGTFKLIAFILGVCWGVVGMHVIIEKEKMIDSITVI